MIMTLAQARDEAIKESKPKEFLLKGRKCKWLDPFMGLFQPITLEGFININDFKLHEIMVDVLEDKV